MDPTVPINGGLLRPIRITAPEGSIVNCTFPAASVSATRSIS
jgi:N-methylhydantoinase B